MSPGARCQQLAGRHLHGACSGKVCAPPPSQPRRPVASLPLVPTHCCRLSFHRQGPREVEVTQAAQPDGSHVFTVKKRHPEFDAAVAERTRLLGAHRQLAHVMLELVLHRLSTGGD